MIRPLIAALVLALSAPLAASAQAEPPAPVSAPAGAPAPSNAAPAHHHHVRYLAAVRSLNLSADQQQQIAGFVRDTKAANQSADHETRHANVKKLRAEILGVLSPDQRTQLHAQLVRQRTAPTPQ